MRIIEITALDNGAHRNQTGNFDTIPDGWAVISDGMATPNFPFGDVTVDETQTPPIVTKWTAGTIPEPETPSPTKQREEAYNTQAIISFGGEMLTVTQASQKWQYYAAEGNTAKTDELTALISEAKASIREQYPDDGSNV